MREGVRGRLRGNQSRLLSLPLSVCLSVAEASVWSAEGVVAGAGEGGLKRRRSR